MRSPEVKERERKGRHPVRPRADPPVFRIEEKPTLGRTGGRGAGPLGRPRRSSSAGPGRGRTVSRKARRVRYPDLQQAQVPERVSAPPQVPPLFGAQPRAESEEGRN